MQQDKTMNANDKVTQKENENPFKDMGFIKFWVVSTIFWFSFPMSLVLCYLALGSVRTRQLVKALVHDFLQTLLGQDNLLKHWCMTFFKHYSS